MLAIQKGPQDVPVWLTMRRGLYQAGLILTPGMSVMANAAVWALGEVQSIGMSP